MSEDLEFKKSDFDYSGQERFCASCGKVFDRKCPGCKRRYQEACGRSCEGHDYAMIYNDGETCLRCGHHRTMKERGVQ